MRESPDEDDFSFDHVYALSLVHFLLLQRPENALFRIIKRSVRQAMREKRAPGQEELRERRIGQRLRLTIVPVRIVSDAPANGTGSGDFSL